MKNLTDREIVLLYSEWSETFYAASFRTLSPEILSEFVQWLSDWAGEPLPLEDYELELVRQYRALAEQSDG